MSSGSYKDAAGECKSIAPSPDERALQVDVPRKYTYKSSPHIGAQSASIARRNARERNRVKQVNDGFNALRKRLPEAVISALSGGARRGTGKKMSKVDTLRMVVEYIRYLENMIDGEETNEAESIAGRISPYSDCTSPINSECSSGVSAAYYLSDKLQSTYPNEYINETEMLSEWLQLK